MSFKEIVEYFCLGVTIIFVLCLVLLFCISSIDEKKQKQNNVDRIEVKENNNNGFNTVPDEWKNLP